MSPESWADVLEVVDAIAASAGISLEELLQAKAAKAAERGGFTARVVWMGNEGEPAHGHVQQDLTAMLREAHARFGADAPDHPTTDVDPGCEALRGDMLGEEVGELEEAIDARDHPRWEIKDPQGDGKNYLITDAAIGTFGRKHIETVTLAGLPPLPPVGRLIQARASLALAGGPGGRLSPQDMPWRDSPTPKQATVMPPSGSPPVAATRSTSAGIPTARAGRA